MQIMQQTNRGKTQAKMPPKKQTKATNEETMQEPPWDERLTWEGRQDKMVQVWRRKNSCNLTKSLNYMVKILHILVAFQLLWIRFAFRTTRCVYLTTTSIYWIMPSSYTSKWFDIEYNFLNNLYFMFQTRNQDQESSCSWQCKGRSTEFIHQDEN